MHISTSWLLCELVASCIGVGFAADTEAVDRIGERHDAIRDAAGRREGVELEIVVVVFLVEVIGVAEDARVGI